jgi:hypothetical protein
MKKKHKFKVGDRVVYIRNITNTSSSRKFGDSFVINTIYEFTGEGPTGFCYYEKDGKDGEYEGDLELATKLHKALL